MGLLFQQFVKTFCERETDYKVSAPKIDWFGAEVLPGRLESETDLRHLPRMQTDIVLRSPGRTIILDTKFYKDPLDTRWEGKRVNAGNLYQIFSYVTNWKAKAAQEEPEPEGWLVYAAVDGDFDYRFALMGRAVRVCSVDLGQEWRGRVERGEPLPDLLLCDELEGEGGPGGARAGRVVGVCGGGW